MKLPNTLDSMTFKRIIYESLQIECRKANDHIEFAVEWNAILKNNGFVKVIDY